MPTLALQFPEVIKVVIALLIEYFLMIFFLMVIMWPLNSVLRNAEIGFKEIVLSSPATAGDIFLGEFIGKLPVYSLGVLGIAPIILGLINPILDLTFLHLIVIYLSIFGVFIFGTLVGTLLASFVEHKVAQSASLRDWSRAFMMVFSIIMVVLIYSLQFFFNFLLSNPELKNWLIFYPPLWYSNVILYVFDPSLLDAYLLDVWSSLALSIFVPILILYISYKKASAFYSLEGGVDKGGVVIDKESGVYSFIRKITGNKWQELIVSQAKQFLRSKENLSKLIYSTGLICAMGIIYSVSLGNLGGGPPGMTTYSFSTLIMIMMGGMMFSIMFGCFIFVNSKDLLWLYKRSPRGIKGLVFSYLYLMLILIVLLSIPITIFVAILFQMDILAIILFFTLFVANCIFSIVQGVGIQCIKPAFEEKGREIAINIISLIIIQMVCFIGSLILVFETIDRYNLDISASLFLPILNVSLNTILSIPIIVIGLKRLNLIE